MGAIESTEAGNIWDSTLEIPRAGEASGDSFREEEGYYGDEYRHREAAAAAAASASPVRESGGGGGARDEGEITSDAEAQRSEASISRSQKTTQIAPDQSSKPASTQRIIRVWRSSSLPYRDVAFFFLFALHLVLVIAGILFLDILYLKSMSRRKLHNLQRWFPQLGAAVVVGGLFAFAWQTLFKLFPALMARAVLWTSSLLTLAASLMLISTGLPSSLGVGILCFVFSICQGVYSCWVNHRIKYAGDLLFCSLITARKVPGAYLVSFWVLLVASLWLVFWSFGVVSALSFKLAPLVVFALLVSLAWTLETLRNVVCTTVARGIAAIYLESDNGPRIPWERSLHAAFTSSFGSICLGSLIVPILHALRVVARGLNRIHGDNEFMFSCADCFSSVMDTLVRYANNSAFVQVGLQSKSFVRASQDTWDLFKNKQLNVVIDTDMTSSFCVLSGIAGGMLCVIVSGGWTFGTHKALTSSVSIVSFIIGYFLVRISMAVLQGAVCAHYVCYGENPGSLEFLTSPVPERLKELLAEADTESAKKA